MKDRRIARGIWRTKTGWRLYTRVQGRLRPKRIHDPEHQKGLVELKQIRNDWKTDAGRNASDNKLAGVAGFAQDARAKYLPAVAAMSGIKERTRHIELWIAEFGDRPRANIQAWEIRQIRDRWLTKGPKMICRPWDTDHPQPPGTPSHVARWEAIDKPLSAAQVNKRLRALENLWTVLDGRHAPNPVRDAGEAVEPESQPRDISYDAIEAIFAQMPDIGRAPAAGTRAAVSLTKLRLRVIAYTGLSHAQLAALKPADVNLATEMMRAPGRRKGKGVRARWVPLSPEAVDALRAFDQANAWGTFSRSSMRQSFKRAWSKLKLNGVRPYDLRHSFLTLVALATGDERVVQELGGHANVRTTRRYTEGSLSPRLSAAAVAIRSALTQSKKLP